MSVRSNRIPQDERDLRRDLAACYRLVAHFGWDDIIYTHISARLPGPEHHFLINPYGRMFGEICASDLVKVDLEGNQVGGADASLNPAGFVIHSAIHMARSDARCVIHLHTRDGVAISALESGLLPLSQSAIMAYSDVAYHEFEGPALNMDERARLTQDLGVHNTMILRNHGTLAVGETVADAFHRIYFVEWACTSQIRALSMGQKLRMPSAEAIAATKAVADSPGLDNVVRTLAWPALLRMIEKKDASYRD